MERFSQLVEDFSEVADFVFVYIAEAHPAETGHFGGNYDIRTHERLEERLAAARVLRAEATVLAARFPALADVDVLVDLMGNDANRRYAALPERLFVLRAGRVAHVGDVGPYGYDIDAVEAWLKKFV